ncbi:hypothetical protein PUN28_005415 [Cardiocondyla obscurior]|uniref:Uncharacterized protein n=1 Tax=Cardiocondyla obscurior TaxID=286306 RepID=A0AAW2GIM9_9HYME
MSYSSALPPPPCHLPSEREPLSRLVRHFSFFSDETFAAPTPCIRSSFPLFFPSRRKRSLLRALVTPSSSLPRAAARRATMSGRERSSKTERKRASISRDFHIGRNSRTAMLYSNRTLTVLLSLEWLRHSERTSNAATANIVPVSYLIRDEKREREREREKTRESMHACDSITLA